jgi:hypothetical protein
MDKDRHGISVIHFDKLGVVRPRSTDLEELREKQRVHLLEIEEAFPFYFMGVMKEIDRGNSIDAMASFIGGILKPIVELLGIIHRPHRYDFGLRYLHRDFPKETHELLQKLIYSPDLEGLRDRAIEAKNLFEASLLQTKKYSQNTS